MLLYGSECWRVTEQDMGKLAAFHHGCLRRILKVFWPNKISNKDLLDTTNSRDIVEEIRGRRSKWLGHVLRKSSSDITRVALRQKTQRPPKDHLEKNCTQRAEPNWNQLG